MTRQERAHTWNRVDAIFRQNQRLEQQVLDAPDDWRQEAAAARYQSETTLNQAELFHHLDQLMLDSGYKKKGRDNE